MTGPIVIKSYQNGITLVLNDNASFEEILGAVKMKFQNAEKFFKNARLSVTFEGKKLSDDEKGAIIDAIEKYGSMEVFCVMEKDENMDLIIDAIASKKDHDDAVNNAVFRRGNVRSGQEIVCDEGIIIVGDVHSGARIESGGNIVVLGELKGTAIAGAGNNTDTFVVAMSMDPVQIQIGDVLARNTDRDNMSSMQKGEVNPQIATVYEDRILIEPLLKSKNTH